MRLAREKKKDYESGQRKVVLLTTELRILKTIGEEVKQPRDEVMPLSTSTSQDMTKGKAVKRTVDLTKTFANSSEPTSKKIGTY